MRSDLAKYRSFRRRTETFWACFVAGLLLVSFSGSLNADDTLAERARVAKAVALTQDFSQAEPFESRPAGAATFLGTVDHNAFSQPSANMSFERRLDFFIGNGIFRKIWVSAPSSTTASDGLGPLFNARSCQRCHLKDGRGHPPSDNWPKDDAVSMFLRLSIPPQTDAQQQLLAEHRINIVPEPTYGGQLQDLAVQGMPAEGRMNITYSPLPVTLADGTVITLRKPEYEISEPGYGPLHPETMISPRVAPPMIGLGLLEMIDEQDILANSDPDDADGDGISGKPNWVWDNALNERRIGRFGWKAGNPTVSQQSAGAFNGDIGISTPATPSAFGDCTEAQKQCREAPNGNSVGQDGFEASGEMLDKVVFYAMNLAVPARREVSAPTILAGKKLFYQSGCAECHRPKFVTRRDPNAPEQSFQLIWPYTDLLLHDMGDGLADHRPEGAASGREWKTPPLWGIGLTEVVNGHSFYLHDGRARNLLEAILWHGGEGEESKQEVINMTPEERDALLAFINDL